ncbi:MAG: bifunctional 5,10-methylenetetrahydrofolate dehydrogenase/5,10-methenyltetrahydrofolate cyclohydrolase [Planctomycetota bacterium]|nr:bifunctional 5,10-methylenetetrahydrofolate dehydrogenase/5,10-methenyltetrahydrofolate cyclohydrolase [Planctomycetota bacterium]
MSARLIDGKLLAEQERARVARRARELRAAGAAVRLDAVLVTGASDAAARVYAENQAKMCAELGIDYALHELPAHSSEDDIGALVDRLNADPRVRAIMVHMPLPQSVDAYRVQSRIAPAKDVEGVNPANIGNIVYGRSSLAPCTALAVLRMIESTGVELRGRFAVCVGASDIVGKPVAVMLMRREATVVSCTKHTDKITELTRQADILVAAAGSPGLVRASWVRPGAVVIDVGINRVAAADGKTKTVGDVAFDEVRDVAGWISPVPGGVGPVTVAMLLDNVVAAWETAPA